MSAKNILQEYFQKQKRPFPKYNTVRVGGPDHKPIWQSTIELDTGEKYIGAANISKTKTEISAAEKALLVVGELNKILSEKEQLHIMPERSVLLVDVENMPKFIDEVNRKITGLQIYAFVGEHHHLAEKDFPSEVIKILSPSTRPDGADTCMQVFVGYLLAYDKYDNFYIATRDHYGSALAEMITSNIGAWTPKQAKLVTQIAHIIN